MNWTRRGVLGGIGSTLALPVWAKNGKPAVQDPLAMSPAEMMASARLSGVTGFCVAEVASGKVLESVNADAAVPPASVAKTITSLFALEHLGPDHRFSTRVMATAPVVGGRLDGDLILAGGGDPTLDTDGMGDLVAALAQTGLRQVSGRFLIYADALPNFARITDEQPVQVGYNPGLSGLALNYNRVNFEWTKGGATLQMNARGERYVPPVSRIGMAAAARDLPVFTYDSSRNGETWTVAQPALSKAGGRWLPVRQVAEYVAEVFATLCAAQGIALAKPQRIAALPDGAVALVDRPSPALTDILREMLKYSTNITAETMGLASSAAPDLPGSAAAMAGWARDTLGLQAQFVDHSGLGAASRVTAEGMMRAIMAGEKRPSGAGLRGILKEVGLKDADGRLVKGGPVRVVAKSGTLNFVSGLVGFIEPPSGRDLAFAIFSADAPRREAVPVAEREQPPGERSWVARARGLQGNLLNRWAAMA